MLKFSRLQPRHLRNSPLPSITTLLLLVRVRSRACSPQTSMAMAFWTWLWAFLTTTVVIAGVLLYLGNSDGTFQSPTGYQVDDASAIMAPHFKNDGGSIDLVAGDMLLVGNGDGTFKPPTSLLVGVAGFRPFAVGDFGPTGSLDIAGAIGVNVQILHNNGEGSFTAGQSFTGNAYRSSAVCSWPISTEMAFWTWRCWMSIQSHLWLGCSLDLPKGSAPQTRSPIPLRALSLSPQPTFNGDNKQDLRARIQPTRRRW